METPVMTVRLDPGHRTELERLAKQAGMTRSDFLRALIVKAIQNQANKQPATSGN